MKKVTRTLFVLALFAAANFTLPAGALEAPSQPKCKPVHADLEENFSNVGCKPGHAGCYLGEVGGNHGLRGTTYFRADAGAAGPATSPGFISYSGLFEYTTEAGSLIMRETGVFNTTLGNPESGALTAFQKIVAATGEWSGTTGHLFVSGFNIGGHVVTTITGELCTP